MPDVHMTRGVSPQHQSTNQKIKPLMVISLCCHQHCRMKVQTGAKATHHQDEKRLCWHLTWQMWVVYEPSAVCAPASPAERSVATQNLALQQVSH